MLVILGCCPPGGLAAGVRCGWSRRRRIRRCHSWRRLGTVVATFRCAQLCNPRRSPQSLTPGAGVRDRSGAERSCPTTTMIRQKGGTGMEQGSVLDSGLRFCEPQRWSVSVMPCSGSRALRPSSSAGWRGAGTAAWHAWATYHLENDPSVRVVCVVYYQTQHPWVNACEIFQSSDRRNQKLL